MNTRSRPFCGVVLYTEISFIETRSRICKSDLVHVVAWYYISRSRLYKRDLAYVNEISSILWRFIIYRYLIYTTSIRIYERDLVHFVALCYIPMSRFYNRYLFYVKEISSILWRFIVYRDLVFTNEFSYMKTRSRPFCSLLLYRVYHDFRA